MKKLKPVLGISLLIQSVTFFILCLVNVEKKKNLAWAFGIFSAIGGAAGAALLVSDYKDRKNFEEDDFYGDEYFDELLDEFEEDDLIEEDEIDCSFANEATESSEAEA